MHYTSFKVFFSVFIYLFIFANTAGAQSRSGSFTNLGVQVKAAMIQGSLFISDTSGIPMVYTVVRGNPAHLLGYRLSKPEPLANLPLPGSDGAWDLAVSSDGWLYIPGAKGSLYRHRPGTQQMEALGVVLPGETTVWNLVAGKDGEMFGATYPGCRVFRYHPLQGFSDVGKGPLVDGESYVRSLAYHKKTGKLYAGIGSHAGLIELDPETGVKSSLLPAEYKNKEFVYSLEILEGLPGGDRLLALITNGSFTLSYNLETKKFGPVINQMDMKAVSQPDRHNRFYYTLNSNLYSRNLDQPDLAPERHAGGVGSANTMQLHNDSLYILNADARLIVMDIKSNKLVQTRLNVPGQPVALQSIMKGPDGRIWSAGYLAGGHAAYDPQTGVTTSYPGLHQTEGMTVNGKTIYFGIYPKGRIYEYDTTQEWNIEDDNPHFIGQVPDQSRSFAVLNDSLNARVFFGMVPEYGKLGGALLTYHTGKKELESNGVPIADQSIVSLVHVGGYLWGGTSVSGGLGAAPTTQEARLFCWDIRNEKVIGELVPVPGAKAITCMINGPDGNIWGMAGGTLFIFNPIDYKVTLTKELYPTPPLKSHVWRDAFLTLHPSGMIYGTGNNKLFSIDPATMKFEILNSPASLLAVDDEGGIYFHRSADLWQFQPGNTNKKAP